MPEHTQTPWRAEFDPQCNRWSILGPHDSPVLAPELAVCFGDGNTVHIVRCVNERDGLVEALREIALGRGAFSRDPLTHAENVIANSVRLAEAALADLEPDECPVEGD